MEEYKKKVFFYYFALTSYKRRSLDEIKFNIKNKRVPISQVLQIFPTNVCDQ